MPGIGDLVGDGQLYLAVPIALLAGLLSFLSPCILPLVPGYLGYVGGASGNGGSADRRRLLLGVSLFILGFTIVFTASVMLSGLIGGYLSIWLRVHGTLITQIAGVIVIVLGLVFIGQFTFLQRTIKPSFAPRTGLIGAPLLGIIFAIGWTPCVGPTLGVIIGISGSSGSAWVGILLGIAFSLGLGIPFLLAALGFGWFASSTKWVKRHIRLVNIIGGSMLIAIGVLMVTGIWSTLMLQLGVIASEFVPAL